VARASGSNICQNIVGRWRGDLGRELAGKGSTFRVTLPVAPTEKRRRDAQAPLRRSGAAGAVVDDDRWSGRRCGAGWLGHEVLAVTRPGRAGADPGRRALRPSFCDSDDAADDRMDFTRRSRRSSPSRRSACLPHRRAFTSGGAIVLDRIENLRLEKPFDIGSIRTLVDERLRAG